MAYYMRFKTNVLINFRRYPVGIYRCKGSQKTQKQKADSFIEKSTFL